MKSKLNPLIFTNRNVVMQRLADAFGHGYDHYESGSVKVTRIEHLVNKFDMNYQALADRNVRARRKRKGLGNATVIFWLHQDTVYWWLLVTSPELGDHAAHTIEKLRNARIKEERIQINGFELVELPKLKEAGTKLTWRMNETKYQDWRHSIIDSVRTASSSSLHHLLYRLWASPGFNGVRSQTGKLVALYRAEVKRRNRKDAAEPPKTLYYLRRLKNEGITLLQLIYKTQPQTDSASAVSDADGNKHEDAVSL